MMEPFPDKSKGIHHDIYTRLFLEHHEAEMEHLVERAGVAVQA